jgi:hypothetical protein
MIHNQELKKCFEKLAQSALVLYFGHYPISASEDFDEDYVHTKIIGLYPQIQAKSEYQSCLGLMDLDPHIKSMIGKMVGKKSLRGAVPDNTSIILTFLEKLYMHCPVYKQELFDKEYDYFEAFFYSDVLNIRDYSRLNNFDCFTTLVDLGHGIYIRKSPNRHAYYASANFRLWDCPKPPFSDFVIERCYETKKIVGEYEGKCDAKLDENLESSRLFDLVLSAMQILDQSDVCTEFQFESEFLTFHPSIIGGPIAPKMNGMNGMFVSNVKFNLEEKNLPDLKKTLSFLIEETNARFRIALRRLSFGIERTNLEDKLIDYMIGLESLFLPGDHIELSFKLAMRIAFILYTDPNQRKTEYDFIRQMYEIRSDIVHGEQYKLNAQQVTDIEGILRISLKLWIKNPSKFTVGKKDPKGNYIPGMLTDVFFS